VTTLPLIDDTTWARMSWRAKRDWLAAANRARREIRAQIERESAEKKARADARAARRAELAERAAALEEQMRQSTIDVMRMAEEIRESIPDDPDAARHYESLGDALRPSRQDRRIGIGRPERRTPEYRAQNAARQRALRARRKAEQEAS
jgi:hypothetical protein